MTDLLIIFLAKYLGWILGVFAILIFLWPLKASLIRANWRMVLEAFGAALVSRFGFTEIIRYFYDRPRPFESGDFIPLIPHETGGSFPSGHAAFLFALAASVFFYDRRLGLVFFIGAILVGLGRVWTGVHWYSDILGGALVGILTSVLVNFLVKKLKS